MNLNMRMTSTPRLMRGLVLLVPAIALLATSGCGHRRQTLRPMYVTPAPVTTAPATTTPSCPTTTVPGGGEPALTVPGGGEPALTPPTLGPAPPAGEVPTPVSPRSSTVTPPRPNLPDQPNLEPVPENIPRATPSNVPPLKAPNTSLYNDRRSPYGRLRPVTLRERLRPLANDPDDLFQPPKADRPWKYIVLHHSANPDGSYDQIDREHRKVLGWQGCGYHFIVGNGTGSPDGQIEVAQRWTNQKNGVHTRNGKNTDVNEYGIGICLVGDLDKAPPTPRQIAATKALIAYLGDRYQIPPDHIGTHARLANSPTACPGKNFPEQAILGSGNHLVQR